MANIRIANLHTAVLESSEITQINAELASAIYGGSGIDFTIGKKWKRPIHVKIDIEVG